MSFGGDLDVNKVFSSASLLWTHWKRRPHNNSWLWCSHHAATPRSTEWNVEIEVLWNYNEYLRVWEWRSVCAHLEEAGWVTKGPQKNRQAALMDGSLMEGIFQVDVLRWITMKYLGSPVMSSICHLVDFFFLPKYSAECSIFLVWVVSYRLLKVINYCSLLLIFERQLIMDYKNKKKKLWHKIYI